MITITPKWGEPKRDLNRWQFAFQIFPDYARIGYVRFIVGVFCLHTRPPVGESLQRGKHYKGFLINREVKSLWQ